MAGIERQEFLARDGVAQIIFGRAGGVALGADAEQLGFHGVEVQPGIDGFGEDAIERFGEAPARAGAIGGDVFVAIGNPKVGDGGRAQLRGPSRRRCGGRGCRVRSRIRGWRRQCGSG